MVLSAKHSPKVLRQALQQHLHVESVAEPPQNEGGVGPTVVECANFVMLSGEQSSEGRLFAVEASLYPHDSSLVAKLLRLHHRQPVGSSVHRFYRQSAQTCVLVLGLPDGEFRRRAMQGLAAARDASTPENHPTDDPPPLSMTEGKVSE